MRAVVLVAELFLDEVRVPVDLLVVKSTRGAFEGQAVPVDV